MGRFTGLWGTRGLVGGAFALAVACGGKATDECRNGEAVCAPPADAAPPCSRAGECPPERRGTGGHTSVEPPPSTSVGTAGTAPSVPPPLGPPRPADAAPPPAVMKDAAVVVDATVVDAAVADATIADRDAADTSVRDTKAPVFSGITIAEVDSTMVVLHWNLANDDLSASNEITYRVYVSTSPDSPSASTPPTVITIAGATSAEVPELLSRTTYYIVVRAVDSAGNESVNTPPFIVKTLTSFTGDVQPIFTAYCALSGCHIPGNPPQGMILQEGYTYANLVDKVAGEGPAVNRPGIKRVDSTSSNLDDSYLWWTIQDPVPPIMKTSTMPPSSTMLHFGDPERQIIGDWIREGAREN